MARAESNKEGAAGGGPSLPEAVSRWLALAAAPTFAAMAALSSRDEGAAMICSSDGGSILGGMAAMYMVMSVVHLGPWIRLAGKGNASQS